MYTKRVTDGKKNEDSPNYITNIELENIATNTKLN